MKIRWRLVAMVLVGAGLAAAFSAGLAYRIELNYVTNYNAMRAPTATSLST